jgi:hypothetical protein
LTVVSKAAPKVIGSPGQAGLMTLIFEELFFTMSKAGLLQREPERTRMVR